MQKFSLSACFLFLAFSLAAQSQKSWDATFLDFKPELDGNLTDSCWQVLAPINGFTTASPVFGKTPHCQTELRLFYTQTALYVAAWCYDPDSAGIRREAGIRDQSPTGDWLQISLDTWNDDQLAFDFAVTAAGVQFDGRNGAQNWDAIWQSAVRQQANGWTVEICIPFTALRFPQKTEQNWGAQFSRYDRSSGELSTWSPQDPLIFDRVIQFGNLTGIRDIRQLQRRSLAVQSNSKIRLGTKPFKLDAVNQQLGIDGRIGLNESTTLDFSLLPPLEVRKNFSATFFANDIEVNTASSLLEPRQFLEEERDLFDKHLRRDYYPKVNAGTLLWRWEAQPEEVWIRQTLDTKPLQVSKLSTRTKGNWRIGVFNALLGPAKVEYSESGINGEFKRKTLQAVSDYLFSTAEYLLPNNGFVNISNTMLLAGKGSFTEQPELHFRLRDRTNSLEVAGGTGFQFQSVEAGKFLGYNWNLAVSRINRRWGWTVRHLEYNQPIIRPGNAALRQRLAVSDANVQFLDFRPHGPFLNVTALAGVNVWWDGSPQNEFDYSLKGELSALDQKFRYYTISLSSKPYKTRLRYQDGGVYIFQEISPEIGGGIRFRTDIRKRFQLHSGVSGTTGLKGEFPKMRLELKPTWVIGQRIRLSAEFQCDANFQSLEVLSTLSGRWIFERFDYLTTQGKLGVQWSPTNRLQILAQAGFFNEKKYKRTAVELLTGGALEVVDWVLEEEVGKIQPTYNFSMTHFFSSISQVRLDLNYQPEYAVQLPGAFPSPTILQPAVLNANLRFIWFIDRTKKT